MCIINRPVAYFNYMYQQLWGKEFDMSTPNRKWSPVAFANVMQWLLWTVILPNKHLIPSSVQAQKGDEALVRRGDKHFLAKWH